MSDLFGEYQNCLYKSIRPDAKLLFMLNRWFSNHPQNAELCSTLDRLHLKADKELLITILNLGIDRKVRFIPYVKKKKEDLELDQYLCRYLGYSMRELDYQRALINKDDLIPKMAIALGWDKKTCKKYGVGYEEPKKKTLKKEPEQKTKSLMGFFK